MVKGLNCDKNFIEYEDFILLEIMIMLKESRV